MRTMGRLTLFVIVAACLVAALGACRRAPVEVQGPEGILGVAGFFQPGGNAELLAGYLPETPVEVKPAVLAGLDASLDGLLREHKRRSFMGAAAVGQCEQQVLAAGEGSRGAMRHWLAVGRCAGVDWLLVPQVTYWRERDGSELSVRDAASVTLDLFLINVAEESLGGRYHFEETQLSLTENILDADKFMARGAKWITAQELAREGIDRGLKEFGL